MLVLKNYLSLLKLWFSVLGIWGGDHFSAAGPGGGELGWAMNPSLLREAPGLGDPSDCRSSGWAWGFGWNCISASPTHLHAALLLFLEKELFS